MKMIFSILLFLGSNQTFAKDLCQEYSNYTPLPTWYAGLCNQGGSGGSFQSSVGGGFSTFGDSYNLNPASIPTMNMPFGIEYITSRSSDPSLLAKSNFAVIKGFKGYGFGLTTDSDDSIYTNRSTHSTIGTGASTYFRTLTQPGMISPSLSLGSAIAIYQDITKLGILARYNKDLKTLTPGFGFTQKIFKKFSLGLSYVFEKETIQNSATKVTTFNIGAKVAGFQLEFIHIVNSSASGIATTSGTRSIDHEVSIGTVSGSVGSFSLTGAFRRSDTTSGEVENIYHFALQFLMTARFSIAYLYNYIPGYQSLSLQYLF